MRDTREADLCAMYRFIRHLGAAGEPAPASLLAEKLPQQPFVQLPMKPR